jgi:hypothetical protein
MVPATLVSGMPFKSATAQYIAQMTVAGGLMVMEVVTLSMGIPSRRTKKSSKESTATPHFPHSPRAFGESVS